LISAEQGDLELLTAGHLPAAVAALVRMTCRMIGDPRWRDGGMVLAAGSGPSGVTWLAQLATVSTMPAAASTLARADDGRGGGWNGIVSVLPG
jgi:hypothetical protein